ncbi:hypothetical protein J4234_04565 [Candidatus Woesearchaeota archaeon]|nr:hypothetical protein [Candidatus Woesearchaeota archaeon]
MKIKILQILAIIYFLLIFLILKAHSIYPLIFLIAALLIDNFTKIRNGIKNLFYVTAALSVFPSVLGIFLLYLPFCVFGALLSKRSFLRNYIFAFALSFIPVNIIYFVTTYFSVPLSYPVIFLIFYSIPIVGIILLRTKAFDYIEVENSECICIFIVLFFTGIIASGIIDDKSLFMANGVRIFTRVQIAVEGLNNNGLVPIYNPGIAMGEATYLWNAPSFKVHAAINDYLLQPKSHIHFFNSLSFFILLLSTLSLSILFRSIINQEETYSNMLMVSSVAVLTGLNFYFLQMLESFKANYLYPMAYLFLSIILDNPKKYNDYLILMYFSALFIIIHLPYGSGVLVIGACLFLITKIYYLKDKSELLHFFNWAVKNKLIITITIGVILLFPIFYLSSGIIYKEFIYQEFDTTLGQKITIGSVISESANFFKGFYGRSKEFFSIKYPDVNRIDDHKIGFFLSVFGLLSFFLLFAFYKLERAGKFRIFALAFLLNLFLSSLFYNRLSILLGGFFRTTLPYLLILMGASILAFTYLFKNKHIKYFLIIAIFIAFIHTIPYAKQNINNIHKEYFAGGDVYREEIEFIKKLPADGRILTYGLFNNAVDFGGNYLTKGYFSRNERYELVLVRTPFEKVHGQNSFGDAEIILNKSGTELSNYLIIGGYKYLFINACHPIGNYVVSVLYPNFTYPIYQNGCLLFLIVNNTNYIEKAELAKNAPDGIYKQKDGYKYITLSTYYNFDRNLNFRETPKKPEALKFQRPSPTEIQISGNFEKDDFVVFKEQYFARWKAYMNNKEVPVMTTAQEMVLIKTDKGNNILLKYMVLPKEKIFGVLSLIAHLGLIILFIYLLRQSIL